MNSVLHAKYYYIGRFYMNIYVKIGSHVQIQLSYARMLIRTYHNLY